MKWMLVYWLISSGVNGPEVRPPYPYPTLLACDIAGGQIAVAHNGKVSWACVPAASAAGPVTK
jgi:hypothetical protein